MAVRYALARLEREGALVASLARLSVGVGCYLNCRVTLSPAHPASESNRTLLYLIPSVPPFAPFFEDAILRRPKIDGRYKEGPHGPFIRHVMVEPVFDRAHSPEPEYPQISRRLGEAGVVVVRVLVAEDGHVLTAELVKSSGFSRLDNAAVETMKRYRFGPGSVDGNAAQLWKTMQFRFQLP